MANEGLSASAGLVFAMGETEKKMGMALDEIIEMSRKKKGKKARTPIKDMSRNLIRQRARPSIRRSSFSRVSGLRQGNLSQARNQNGNGIFRTTEAAARKNLSAPRASRWKRSSRKFPRRFPASYAAAAGKMKISVTNVATKNGASAGYRRVLAFGQLVASSKVEVNYQPKKLRTLDSLFANLKQQRAMQFQSGSQGYQKRSNLAWKLRTMFPRDLMG